MKVNSSFWYTDLIDDEGIQESFSEIEQKNYDLYKLASSKRAISNFVNIVTNQNIPVKFNQRGDSYTDGKSVVISSRITKPQDFDVAVGLALHEGSHIKLSDFTMLRDLSNLIPTKLADTAFKKGVTNPITIVKNLTNYVEDRRIDQYVFSSAPGYRDYYRSMYDKYFNDPLIDKALQSDEYTEHTIDSFMFRIINLHNKNTSLDALSGLRDIYRVIDLKNISRLKSSHESLLVALQIFEIILNNIPKPTSDEGDEFKVGEGESEMSGDTLNTEMNGNGGETPEFQPTTELTERQKGLIEKKVQKQKDFLAGDIQKTSLAKKDIKSIESIDESGSEIVNVADDLHDEYGNPWIVKKGFDVIVVKKMTLSLMKSRLFPFTSFAYMTSMSERELYDYSRQSVEDGIKLGTKLGRKLQVRNEERTTVYNRQKVGKIDKRMISSLGFGNENVFSFKEIDSFNKVNLHVSIDASGSMAGEEWHQAIINVVALCKATDMIPNLDIQVTFRGESDNKPYVVLAYDSRQDKFIKVKQLFPYLQPGGTTPESLCYEAIMKHFVPSSNELDSYFLNISDGEPNFSNRDNHYWGEPAVKHTRKMMKQLGSMGVQVLSYFVSRYHSERQKETFREMYGNGATFIDVTNMNQVTKTMNQLFLEKT